MAVETAVRVPPLLSRYAVAICSSNLEWVAYEYAKLRRLYDTLGFSARTSIEFFNGVHEIHQAGTIEFLKRSLDWPDPTGI